GRGHRLRGPPAAPCLAAEHPGGRRAECAALARAPARTGGHARGHRRARIRAPRLTAHYARAMRGVVAAGHPLTAEAGADVLRGGGNAVDAAVAALMTSFMSEPLLTGLGAGGYMLVAPPGGEPALLDFMVAAPGEGERSPLDAVVIDFGDAVQVFHIGASSCGVYGVPAGIASAAARFASVPLPQLAAPAIAAAREGVVVNH